MQQNSLHRSIQIILTIVTITLHSTLANSAPPSPMTCVGAEVGLTAKQGWHTIIPNTNIGDLLEFTAGGRWSYYRTDAQNFSGPDGHNPTPPDAAPNKKYFVMPSVEVGTLIARIGDGAPFVIGANRALSASASGPLQMRMNDVLDTSDNEGGLSVKYKICRNG